MPEQAQKLLHFTDNVLKTATEESEALARELEAKRQAALTEARQTSRDDAHAYYERESARIRAEAGQEVSRHLMDGKRQVYLRRSEISREVLDKVRGKLDEFVASPQYPEHLKGLLAQTVSRLDGVHEMVIQLRREDLPLGQKLADSVAPVPGAGHPGGLLLRRAARGAGRPLCRDLRPVAVRRSGRNLREVAAQWISIRFTA